MSLPDASSLHSRIFWSVAAMKFGGWRHCTLPKSPGRLGNSSKDAGCAATLGSVHNWGKTMRYRIIYSEAASAPTASTEEFPHEHQALGRARELLETGEHHGVAVDDGAGHVLHGVRLQLKLGGFSGD
jgi:hypothetical protein